MHNRSSNEIEMRRVIEAWGRKRWPDARVFHELTIGECRIDMAFICPNNLIGIELKSSKDTLERLPNQLRVFLDHIPIVYVAFDQRWVEHKDKPRVMNELIVEDGVVRQSQRYTSRHPNVVYNKMTELLWADEARSIAARNGLPSSSRTTLGVARSLLCEHLTGRQIMAEVCRELRGRPTAYQADDPIRIHGKTEVLGPRVLI